MNGGELWSIGGVEEMKTGMRSLIQLSTEDEGDGEFMVALGF